MVLFCAQRQYKLYLSCIPCLFHVLHARPLCHDAMMPCLCAYLFLLLAVLLAAACLVVEVAAGRAVSTLLFSCRLAALAERVLHCGRSRPRGGRCATQSRMVAFIALTELARVCLAWRVVMKFSPKWQWCARGSACSAIFV